MSLFADAIQRDTRANQPAASAVVVGTLYCVTDEGDILERSNGSAWESFSPTGGGSGDVTASGTLTASRLIVGGGTTVVSALGSLGTTTTLLHGNAAGAPTFGAVVTADITNANVTLGKIANASANDKLLGSGNSGSGASYAEITLGSGLTMTGTTLSAAGGGGGMGLAGIGTFVPPVDSDYAWVNQNGATSTQVGDGLVLTGAAAGSGNWEWALRVKTAPSTPYTITAYIIPSLFRENFRHDCLVFRDSASGKFSTLGPMWNTFGGTDLIAALTYSDATTNNSTLATAVWVGQVMPFWWQISDDGTDRFYRYSNNGVTWTELFTEGRTAYFTANQVGFGINRRTAGTSTLSLLSWDET